MSIGEKGMLVAAKTIAATAVDLYRTPATIEKARADQKQMMAGLKYTTLIPEGQKAPKTIRLRSASAIPELREFVASLDEQRQIGIGVFPELEELLIVLARLFLLSHLRLHPRQHRICVRPRRAQARRATLSRS